MQAIVHAADIQDRDGGVLLMGSLFGLYPFLLKPGNRQTIRPPQIRRAAKAVDRRADDRLAQPLPTAGQRLGMPEPLRACLPTLGLGPRHAPKTMPKHKMISDGL